MLRLDGIATGYMPALAQDQGKSSSHSRMCSVEPLASPLLAPCDAQRPQVVLVINHGEHLCQVKHAAELLRDKRPDLAVEGPIQYDAAVDPDVAAVKVKSESKVAGHANVCIFPDLNTGNNTYKVRDGRCLLVDARYTFNNPLCRRAQWLVVPGPQGVRTQDKRWLMHVSSTACCNAFHWSGIHAMAGSTAVIGRRRHRPTHAGLLEAGQ